MVLELLSYQILESPALSNNSQALDLVGADASVLQFIDGLLGLRAIVKDGHDRLWGCCHVYSPLRTHCAEWS
jgi:hypothetical protein